MRGFFGKFCFFWLLLLGIGWVGSWGCRPQQPYYLFEDGDLSHYIGEATRIEYPDAHVESLEEVAIDGQQNRPFTLQNPDQLDPTPLALQEAVRNALLNSKVLRQLGGQVLTAPESISRAPDALATVYDPALAESHPQYGTEAALAAFDAQLAASVFWSRGDRPQNYRLLPGEFAQAFLPVRQTDAGTFMVELSKTNATGGTTALRNHVNYEWNNMGLRRWPSDWYVDWEVEIRQPLLQGAGVQFNRIAGPGGRPGVYNGIILARINTDIRLTEFEAAVRNLVMDVERTYWELWLAYHELETAKQARDAMLETWMATKTKLELGARGGTRAAESQVREQYFLYQSLVQEALNKVYTVENNLRYLMGISATDGRLFRPSDEPTMAKITFPWQEVHQEALVRSVELRRLRWRVKQREMELIAAKNFLLPRLDAVGRYRWLGLGDDLISTKRYDEANITAYQSLTSGRFQEWAFGLELDIPIGFRRELAAVRNAQLNLAKERALLQEAELEVSHQISQAIRDLEGAYELMRTAYSRLQAAKHNADTFQTIVELGAETEETRGAGAIFLRLESLRRLAESKNNFYRTLAAYNQAIALVHYRKGSLLEYNGVYLAEGPWPAKAYFDAVRRARERDAALYLDYGYSLPRVLSRGLYQQHQGTTVGESSARGTPPSQGPAPSGQPEPTPEAGHALPEEPLLEAPEPPGQTKWVPKPPATAGVAMMETPTSNPRERESSGSTSSKVPPATASLPSRLFQTSPAGYEETASGVSADQPLSRSFPVCQQTASHETNQTLPTPATSSTASGWKAIQR
ncbi:MAG: TolC family protein [Thermoguttaceae bacterium]|nr:TolC family protein [Thermoguttaceae bacterium]MDW8037041.1 TolC family protein [Thermoguttaceae bacterium]